MTVKIIRIEDAVSDAWDNYVLNHPDSNIYHLSGWKNVIEKTYGHPTFYLAAIDEQHAEIKGILPLVHLKHFLFGNAVISLPFFDMGGILSDDYNTTEMLFEEAVSIAKAIGADELELRHSKYVENLGEKSDFAPDFIKLQEDKVRMLLKLPETSEGLMKSFKAKLRSQIKKPIKEGLDYEIGGIELLDEFYAVFLVNMRDLGSPVHSKKMLKNTLEEFNTTAKIVVVRKDGVPLAVSLIAGHRDVLENPWASSLKQYSRLSPNMLLYWAMLEYACDNGFKYFDFGRSTPDEGTFRFKKQWGAEPFDLQWQCFSLNKPFDDTKRKTDKSNFAKAIHYWKKLPLPVTRFLGPKIRRNIGL